MEDADLIQFIMQLPPEQQEALFRNFPQEQSVLDQKMDIAKQMQQPGPQHSTPWGALLGGLSDIVGKGAGAYKQGQALQGQAELGQAMSADAAQRFKLMNQMTQKQAQNQALLDAINLSPAAML